ncbi:MAG: sigma-54 dependent transcriptional regulator, partial [Polyangia bacterium]
VVDSNASVLVEGETGTGKELVARALHSESNRAKQPFVVLDCGAIPAALIESELFGHVRGAFTGATEQREGAFERADGGVLLLDELGELAIDLQPKLLRVLETQEVRKVGGTTSRKVDVRVVAATNRQLDEAVDAGTFREDLYYRVAVVHVALPPLRERPDDLPTIIAGVLRELGVPDAGPVDGPNLQQLAAHDWPGNVRELRNVLQRGLAQAGSAKTRFRELSLHVRARKARAAASTSYIDLGVPFLEAKEALVSRFEANYLGQLLEASEGNVTEAARRSGLNRRHLHDLLKKYELKR